MTHLGRLYHFGPHGYYIEAKVFNTKEEMYQYIRDQGGDPGDCDAMSLGFTRYNTKGNRTKQLGEVVFYRDRLGVGIVAHELTHAMFNFLRFRFRDFSIYTDTDPIDVDGQEEAACYALGDITTQFWKRYYERIAP